MMTLLRQRLSQFPKCRPPAWCRDGHLQTLIAHFTSQPKLQIKTNTRLIPVSHGDFLVGYYSPGRSSQLVILLHGLGGSSQSSYIVRLANQFSQDGHHVLLINHRGADLSQPSQQIYHSGRSDDLSDVFAWARKEFPTLFQIAVGFSMSANILLLNLGGYKSSHQPDFAIAVNAPICLETASNLLSSGWGKIYGTAFVHDLAKLKNTKVSWNTTIREFDESFTAPWGGFSNADDYYQSCSAKKYVRNIKTPAVVLMTEDDPFISTQPYKQIEWPEHVHLRIEKSGGHMGYLHQSGLKIERWMDKFIKFTIDNLPKA